MTPNKITIEPDFVDEFFEYKVLKLLPTKVKKTTLRNQVIRFGSSVPYKDNIQSNFIPEIFTQFGNFFTFDSVTINEYMPGQCIDWHIDKKDGGPEVIIISLLSAAQLDFRKDKEKISFTVPRYSLTRFSEEIRDEWEHYTKAESRRVSVVFRNSKVEI